jgi:catechol-2,3-dioxygenase
VKLLAASSTASQVYPGLLGFLVVAGMGLALFFLFRSMNKQFHKIAPGQPSSAPPGEPRPPRPGLAAFRAERARQAQANPAQTGPAQTGPAQTGAPAQPGPAQPGAPDQAGNSTP